MGSRKRPTSSPAERAVKKMQKDKRVRILTS
jgi:hypothetical protein